MMNPRLAYGMSMLLDKLLATISGTLSNGGEEDVTRTFDERIRHRPVPFWTGMSKQNNAEPMRALIFSLRRP